MKELRSAEMEKPTQIERPRLGTQYLSGGRSG